SKLWLQYSDYLIWIVWAGIVFAVVFGIYKKITGQAYPLKKPTFWVAWLIATPISYVAAVFIAIAVVTHTPSQRFSTEFWSANKQRRTEVIDDLVDSRRLVGLTRTEVVELLGEPIADCQYFAASKSDMVYNLGLERGLYRIDDEWLLVWLKDSVVVRYEVRTD
ncbi:MAG: hypothetical protein NTW07_00875, partial [candidate division Zixibacteria bacterium]|nr:hypothetical protein [candidate division Zixibacteria bacterium]